MSDIITKTDEQSELSEDQSPGSLSRRSMVIGGALLACGTLAIVRQPASNAKPITEKKFKALLPAAVGPWQSRPSFELILPPADTLSEKLYENLETRMYEGDDLPQVMFLIAYSSIQRNDVQVHRPEVCYPVAGLPILSNEARISKIGNRTIQTRFLSADRGGPKEYILYWTRVGERFPLQWSDQRIAMMQSNLMGQLPDGALVRFSLISNDPVEASATLTKFATQMAAELSTSAKMIFFGTAS